MKTVTLKTGVELPEAIVATGMLSLEHLIHSNPIAFFELVAVCRDLNHQIFGNAGDVLSGLALLELDGRPHDAIRDIVLAATEGEGLGLRLGSPLAVPPTSTTPA